MKWRNQLLALFCLIVFLGFGVLYFQHWVVQKPFGIILFIGEGLDATRLPMARIYAGGASTSLTIDSLPNSALLRNYSLDSAIPDQAAAASALATGVKIKNGTIGVDGDGKTLVNLLELAREDGRMTGLVTDALVTDPTSAAFYAHTKNPEQRADLARTLVENAPIDVVLGGGAADFLPERKGGRRTDDRDLTLELRDSGYDIVQNLQELDAVPRWRSAKLFGLFGQNELAFADEVESSGDQPTLSDMVRRGIELLQFNGGGYVLVVDAALMGRAARQNNSERTLAETIELDRAVAVALRYAGNKSMIIVCGDVGIGGLNLNGSPPREQNTPDAAHDSRLTWASGPLGPHPTAIPTAEENGDDAVTSKAPPDSSPAETAALYFPAARNNATDVIAFGMGLGTDALQGSLESTAIFTLIRDNL
ncbi:MAG: alkaline phosphatase [Chthoniobacterales bacterium]